MSPFPMRGEPEVDSRFQCGVSLKPERRMLRRNDATHGQFRTAESGRDGTVSDEQPARPLVGCGTGSGLRAHRASVESAAIPSAEQRTKGDREALSGQGHRLEPGPTDALDPALEEDTPGQAEAGAATAFPRTLHPCRYRSAGRVGRGSSGPVGSGGAAPGPAGRGRGW